MKRVLVGMSGGVDSSVAAYLLKKEGYEVVGVTMTLFKPSNNFTPNQIEDAKKICEQLGIEHHVVNYQDFFKNEVIDNFINSYLNGETPNPCVVCNKKLKFGLLWEKAKELNCEYIATGHYANIKDGKICKVDSPKDQSYFLYGINKEVIPHILFPLNKYYDKEIIRELAAQADLSIVSKKKDSQDICFIESGNYADFLEENLQTLPDQGEFVLIDGPVIGHHKGIIYYTIGQRKGLGINYFHPLYVISIDKENNKIILGKEEDLYNKIVYIKNYNILVEELPKKAQAKIRYKSNFTPCTIEIIDNENIKVIFDEPIKSATPGQSLVFYDNDIVLGGGIISKIEKGY